MGTKKKPSFLSNKFSFLSYIILTKWEMNGFEKCWISLKSVNFTKCSASINTIILCLFRGIYYNYIFYYKWYIRRSFRQIPPTVINFVNEYIRFVGKKYFSCPGFCVTDFYFVTTNYIHELYHGDQPTFRQRWFY